MTEFKVGDKIKVSKDNNFNASAHPAGRIGTIVNIDGSNIPYECRFDDSEMTSWIRNVELVEEVKPSSKKYEWKKGDKLEVISTASHLSGLKVGDIVIADENVSANNNEDTCYIIYTDGEQHSIYVHRFKKLEGGKIKMGKQGNIYNVIIVDRRTSKIVMDKNIAAQDATSAVLKVMNGKGDVNDVDHYHYEVNSIATFETEKDETKKK